MPALAVRRSQGGAGGSAHLTGMKLGTSSASMHAPYAWAAGRLGGDASERMRRIEAAGAELDLHCRPAAITRPG
jgi:hypothetical protein